jgi:16S rRNA (cytidine1402-2'-O)-methyltransferase
MEDLVAVFPEDRPMALARELTKDYEEVRRASVAQIRDSVVEDPPRGELVLVIQGASEEEVRSGLGATAVLSIEDLAAVAMSKSESEGVRIKDAIAEVIAQHPLPDGSYPNKKAIYNATLAMKNE